MTEPADPGRERWRQTTRARAMRGQTERRPTFLTTSDIPIADLYTPADIAELDEDRDLGRPGEFPFTRGVQPTMYRGRLWTMRQYAGFSTAADTNERFRYLLSQGQTGLSVAFDLPTQTGYDSDAPEALGEVGRVGVPISSIEDMEVLLDGLPLGEVTSSMTINATAAVLLAFYVAVADRRGIPRELAGRHGPERHPQGVHRPGHLDLPHPTVDAPGDRHLRVLRRGAAALEHHQHQRLPHARGWGHRSPGAGVHAGRCHRLRGGGSRARAGRGRLRGSAVVLLRILERAVRGGRQVPRRAPDVGAHHARPVRGARGPLDDVPVPHPDRGQQPHRHVHRQQRRPDHGPGARRRSWAAPRACTPTPGTRRSRCRPRSQRGWRSGPSRSWPTRAA